MKALKRIFALCLIAGSLVFLAGFISNENEAAVVIKDSGCGVLDGNGNSVWVDATISVQNHGGITVVVCKGKGLNNPNDHAVIWNYDNTGLMCGTVGGSTMDWQNVVSENGNVTLKCKVGP